MASILLEGFGPQRSLTRRHALLVQAQGLLAAGGVFGQKDVSIGAVGADGQGVLGKLDPALFVGFLESLVHERLGLAERLVLLRLALQPGDQLLHDAFHRPAVGEFIQRRRRSPSLRPLATWFSLFPGHPKNLRAMIGTLWPFYLLPACLPCRIVAFWQMALPRHRLLVKYHQAAAVSPTGTDHAQEEEKEAGKWNLLKTLVRYGLYGAAYGVVLGSLLGAVEGAMTGALVGAAILGLVGLAAGAKYGMLVGRVNRMRYGSLAGGFLGALAGVVVGAVIGAMVVAYAGTLVGGIIGALVGRLLAKSKWRRLGSFEGTIIGAGVGAVVVACCRDQEKALAWAFQGAWLGACAGVLLVLAVVGSLALAARNRIDG